MKGSLKMHQIFLMKDSATWLHCIRRAVFVLFFAMVTVFAGAEVVFENKTFDIGTVVEGTADSVMVEYTVKNTGDELLRIENVNPISMCMKTAQVDSLIRPGTFGKIDVIVSFDGFRSGQFLMGITVSSNAENKLSDTLLVKMIFQRVVDYTESSITINAATTGRKRMYLSSKKSDLEVTDVLFMRELEPAEKKAAGWQPVRPVTIDHTWGPTDSVRSDGCRVFRLDLLMPEIDKAMPGDFIVKTNHPVKPEIIIRGTLLK